MSRNDELLRAAENIRQNAYAPYSSYKVGAAILADNGKVYCGCNVENAAYPEGVCAEASAISVMVADGGRQIMAIAIAGPKGEQVTPCGGCRQKIREFANAETSITTGDGRDFNLDDLLPVSFGPENLK